MKDQHEKIKGYRDLSQEEIDLMNEVKELAEKCGETIRRMELIKGVPVEEGVSEIDKRSLALAKTNLQQGFMWLIRSVAKPDSF